MKKAMETVQDLIEEAKIRTVWWALCIFSVSYFLTHTSKSMWMNVPISVLIVCGLRILCNEVEFRWKVRNIRRQTYLSHLEKKQLSVNDSRLSTTPPPPKWKRKIDSPVVEAAMDEFVNKLLQDFVVDLWYSDITPDKEAPELIHAVVMDVLGELSGRVKEINLVELLTRDIVDLIGKNLDLFRRNQAAIGMEVMGTLSSEERDERLKHHLLTSKELHPALISSECEYKVLQHLTGGLLAVALRPWEAQCPLIRCIARELLTCLVMQPLINLASPAYINELIEHILLALKDVGIKQIGIGQSPNVEGHKGPHVPADQHHVEAATNITTSHNKGTDLTLSRFETAKGSSLDGSENFVTNTSHNEAMHPRSAEWARVLEAATQRRTEVLMPENLENMWAIGRNYKKKVQKLAAGGQTPLIKGSNSSNALFTNSDKEILANKAEALTRMEDKAVTPTPPRPPLDSRPNNHISSTTRYTPNLNKVGSFKGNCVTDESENSTSLVDSGNKNRLTRSNSTPDLNIEPELGTDSTSNSGGSIISEFYNKDLSRKSQALNAKSASNMVLSSEGQHAVKLRCRVVGAYFEKLGSKSFAVYSIAVTDIDGITWFVKRRYRNFERLHRQLKDISNYTLHLPPKRIFSSSTEDAFVHQRCIQLDKYLQDLLSIANVAEQHEVWDFLSVSSKNYSFGKSPSVMKSLAVNVDDAMDDIVRQFKEVSDGLMRKVASPSSSVSEPASSVYGRNFSLKEDEINKLNIRQHTANSVNSFSDNEEGDKSTNPYGEETGSSGQTNGWHSDYELNSKEFPPRVVKRSDEFRSVGSDEKDFRTVQSESFSPRASRGVKFSLTSEQLDDPIGVPPEWTPPNLSVPLLNLVDNVFQLKRRGWLRRQVFWISKQILQLMMEDAIDDWLLMQIHWLRRGDTIAQGIRWIQDVLWPGGKFFLKLNIRSKMDDNETNDISSQSTSVSASSNASKPGSFELQLEAARRASNVKKMILIILRKFTESDKCVDVCRISVILRKFTESDKCVDVCRISGGAPTALVSLIGHKQYKRCARDIYYFIQSTICLKQVTYEILELVLVSIFPEMCDVVLDMHEKMRAQPL